MDGRHDSESPSVLAAPQMPPHEASGSKRTFAKRRSAPRSDNSNCGTSPDDDFSASQTELRYWEGEE